MSAPPTSPANARPPCRALDASERCHLQTARNHPLRGFGMHYLGQRPPLLGRPFSLPHPPPQATPRVAGFRPPCCPTPPTLPRSSAVHPRLPAGPSPSSFVAPSTVNGACGHFLLHERLELLLTCAPGGYDTESASAQIFACTTTCTGTTTTCTSTTATTTTTTCTGTTATTTPSAGDFVYQKQLGELC